MTDKELAEAILKEGYDAYIISLLEDYFTYLTKEQIDQWKGDYRK